MDKKKAIGLGKRKDIKNIGYRQREIGVILLVNA